MRRHSYNFQKPDFQLFIYIILMFCFSGMIFEYLLYNPWIISKLPPPSPGLSYIFPEVGVKFERYFSLRRINCLFFGSSMVDAGLDPEILEGKLNIHNNPTLKCMNFGLSGAMVESSSKVSQTLVNWQSTDVIIFGISPIEFDEKMQDLRKMTNRPVFEMQTNSKIERWLLNRFRLPWFYFGLVNRKDKGFVKTQRDYENLLNSRGFRVSNKSNDFDIEKEEFRLHDFNMNQVDFDALEEVIKTAQAKGIKIIVIEMPVMPSYFPLMVEGGGPMYEQRFIKPIQKLLQSNGLSLIRTQPIIGELLDDEHWINENHMNYQGANIFTTYLADQILQSGDWQ